MKKKSRRLLKWQYLIFGIVLILAVFFITYFFILDSSSRSSSKDDKEYVSFEYSNCYILMSGFKSYHNDISIDDLVASKVYTNLGASTVSAMDLGFSDVEYASFDDVYNFAKSKSDEDILILTSAVFADSRLKTMKVNGVNFWDKEMASNYPLCFADRIEVEEDLYDEMASKYYLFEDRYYDFDFAKITTIFAAGETIPARAVDRTWLDQSDNYTLLFDRYKDNIKNSTLALMMLENAFLGDPEPCRGCMLFVSDERNIPAFFELGFDAFGIGNHFGDGGKASIDKTIELVEANGMQIAGVSSNSLADASSAKIMNMGDKKVALVAFDDVATYYWAGVDHYGTNRLSKKAENGSIQIDYEKISQDIEAAKSQADYVIVMVSWGVEYTNKSGSHQKAMAHALIDGGADLILGSHPHWVQEVELYKDKFIFYSLGNFVFDQTSQGPNDHWSRINGETREGASLEIYYHNGEIKFVEIIPHKMCGYDQAGGESKNQTHNLAWKVQAGEMSYLEVDQFLEKDGCVWYQPTPQNQDSSFYKSTWERMMEFTDI